LSALLAISIVAHYKVKQQQIIAVSQYASANTTYADILEQRTVLQSQIVANPTNEKRLIANLGLFLSAARDESTKHMLMLDSIGNPNRSVSGEGQVLTKLYEPVANTESIKKIRLEMRGTYRSYPLLKQYLQRLREFPIAITYLKLGNQQFELKLDIYGTT